MNRFLILGLVAMLAVPAGADVLVSTINGFYDVHAYDTPSLQVYNTTCVTLGTCYAFTNVSFTLTGYQGDNNGVVQSTTVADISGGSSPVYVWGGGFGSGTGLFAYDYDDSDGGHVCLFPDPAGNDQYVNGGLCGQPGNFYVTFTATLSGAGIYDGMSIFSQFSPNNNATGGFVGWEGLDQLGYSETIYDSHSNGGPNGTLANIYIGTPPPIGTPEPSSLVLLGTGLIGIGTKAWKHFLG